MSRRRPKTDFFCLFCFKAGAERYELEGVQVNVNLCERCLAGFIAGKLTAQDVMDRLIELDDMMLKL